MVAAAVMSAELPKPTKRRRADPPKCGTCEHCVNPAPGKACLKVQEAREAAAFEAELGNLLDNHGQIRSTQVPALISHMGRTLSFQYRAVYLTILERTAKGSAAVMEEAVRHEHFLPIIKKWLEEFVEKKRWEELKPALESVLSFPISTELLASSKVGVTVKQVQKVEDKGCREAAAKLVNKWRAMLSAGKATRTEGAPAAGRSATEHTAAEARAGAATSPRDAAAASDDKPSVVARESPQPLSASATAPLATGQAFHTSTVTDPQAGPSDASQAAGAPAVHQSGGGVGGEEQRGAVEGAGARTELGGDVGKATVTGGVWLAGGDKLSPEEVTLPIDPVPSVSATAQRPAVLETAAAPQGSGSPRSAAAATVAPQNGSVRSQEQRPAAGADPRADPGRAASVTAEGSSRDVAGGLARPRISLPAARETSAAVAGPRGEHSPVSAGAGATTPTGGSGAAQGAPRPQRAGRFGQKGLFNALLSETKEDSVLSPWGGLSGAGGKSAGTPKGGGSAFGAEASASDAPVARLSDGPPRKRKRDKTVSWADQRAGGRTEDLVATRLFLENDLPANAKSDPDAAALAEARMRANNATVSSGFSLAAQNEHILEFQMISNIRKEHEDEQFALDERLEDMVDQQVSWVEPLPYEAGEAFLALPLARGEESLDRLEQAQRSMLARTWNHRADDDPAEPDDPPPPTPLPAPAAAPYPASAPQTAPADVVAGPESLLATIDLESILRKATEPASAPAPALPRASDLAGILAAVSGGPESAAAPPPSVMQPRPPAAPPMGPPSTIGLDTGALASLEAALGREPWGGAVVAPGQPPYPEPQQGLGGALPGAGAGVLGKRSRWGSEEGRGEQGDAWGAREDEGGLARDRGRGGGDAWGACRDWDEGGEGWGRRDDRRGRGRDRERDRDRDRERDSPRGRDQGRSRRRPSLPERRVSTPCRFFGTAQGCRFGSRCLFSHDAKQ